MRDHFSPEEWAELCTAPFIAGMYVATAGGAGGAQYAQEMVALLEAVGPSVARGGPLAAAVAADLTGRRGNSLGTGAASVSPQDRPAMLARLARAGAALARAGAEEAAAYRAWVVSLASQVAGAASDGGVLGLGGRRVSYAEQTALAELREALGA